MSSMPRRKDSSVSNVTMHSEKRREKKPNVMLNGEVRVVRPDLVSTFDKTHK